MIIIPLNYKLIRIYQIFTKSGN